MTVFDVRTIEAFGRSSNNPWQTGVTGANAHGTALASSTASKDLRGWVGQWALAVYTQ
jgi:hypothetical protein